MSSTAEGIEAGGHIFGKGDVSVSIDGDGVVIVEADQPGLIPYIFPDSPDLTVPTSPNTSPNSPPIFW